MKVILFYGIALYTLFESIDHRIETGEPIGVIWVFIMLIFAALGHYYQWLRNHPELVEGTPEYKRRKEEEKKMLDQ